MEMALDFWEVLNDLEMQYLTKPPVEKYQQKQKRISNRRNIFVPVRWKKFGISTTGECAVGIPAFAFDIVTRIIKEFNPGRFEFSVETAIGGKLVGDSFLCAEFVCAKFYLVAWDESGKECVNEYPRSSDRPRWR